jgi:hypothetical protein
MNSLDAEVGMCFHSMLLISLDAEVTQRDKVWANRNGRQEQLRHEWSQQNCTCILKPESSNP